MVFSERCVGRCERLFRSNVVDELAVRDVLGCREVDVSRLDPYLDSEDADVRIAAVRIVGQRGRVDSILGAAMREKDTRILLEMMKHLGQRKGGVEALDGLLRHENSIVREGAIAMFRRAGRTDILFPLLFDEDNAVVQRIKGYLDEQG